VELKVVHKVNCATALSHGPAQVHSRNGKAYPDGIYLNLVWGPVAASFNLPLPRLTVDIDGSASRNTLDRGEKSRAVFNLIQHLPESIRTGDYAQANAWLRGGV